MTPTAAAMPAETLSVRPIDTYDLLLKVQTVLVPALFGGASPDSAEILRSFRRNSRRSIALTSDQPAFPGDQPPFLVGFASFWPIRAGVARKLLRGSMVEAQLKCDDILTQAFNRRARFAIVSGIGVLPSASAGMRRRAACLLGAFEAFVADEFLVGENRELTLVATAYSPEGERLCLRRRMGRRCTVADATGQTYPVYSKLISAQDLRRGSVKGGPP